MLVLAFTATTQTGKCSVRMLGQPDTAIGEAKENQHRATVFNQLPEARHALTFLGLGFRSLAQTARA